MNDVTVVIMTRNRVDELCTTLQHLQELPERPHVMVVDNGSTDATAEQVAQGFPAVTLVRHETNIGVAARTRAVSRAATPYVAFNDDDSWWEPGSLATAVDAMEAHPQLGAVTARVLVEPGGRLDPTSAEMRRSPVRDASTTWPGVPVVGFLACATMVRREAFLSVGGFEARFHFGGEEQLLAADLMAAGWGVRYLDDAVVHHAASTRRDPAWRRRRDLRNHLWFLWMRRPAGRAVHLSIQRALAAGPATSVPALVGAAWGLPWVLRDRDVLPPAVEQQLRLLEA